MTLLYNEGNFGNLLVQRCLPLLAVAAAVLYSSVVPVKPAITRVSLCWSLPGTASSSVLRVRGLIADHYCQGGRKCAR